MKLLGPDDRWRQLLGLHPGWLALASALALSSIGIMAIGTAQEGTANTWAQSQTVWLGIAVVALAVCVLPHPRKVGLAAYPLMGITLALLVFVLVPFVPRWIVEPRNGARSWINLYFMAFQPSELAKIVFVLALAWYLRFRENYRTLGGLLVPFAIMFVPVGLILKQPDLGTSLLFAPALFAMLLAAGAKMRHLLTLLAIALLVTGTTVAVIEYRPDLAGLVLKGHQQDRIKAMISLTKGDRRYEKNIAYQQTKAMDLVGAGRFTGYGKERSPTIVRFNHLPEAHNDMIFAVVVNRWGFVGGAATLLSYLLLLISFVLVAAKTKDPFMRLTTIGFGGMIFSQAVLNIAMTIGLMPITGITLPFISYGGSSLATTFAMIGLVVNFASRRQAIVARPTFEFDNADVIYQ